MSAIATGREAGLPSPPSWLRAVGAVIGVHPVRPRRVRPFDRVIVRLHVAGRTTRQTVHLRNSRR
jgi:hypothetical protein